MHKGKVFSGKDIGTDGTKALTGTGEKTFAAGETMAIIYKNSSNQTVKAVSEPLADGDITGSKSATFTFTLTDPDRTKNVAYIYPAAMAAETVATDSEVDAEANVNYAALNTQDGTLTMLAANLDFCTKSGAWNEGALPTLILENQLAILVITLKDNAATPAEITSSVTGMTLSDGTYKYTVKRSAAAGPIYVAIRPTSGANIMITAAAGSKPYTKSLTCKTYEKGNGYSVSWRMTDIPGALSGIFTVNASGKTVYFSQGNLQASTTNSWASWTFSFMEHQYSIVETTADPYCTANYGDKTVVSLFGWGTSGYDHRTYFWQPYNTKNGSFNSGDASNYYNAYGNVYFDLNQADQDGRADWGYNAISNGGNTENSGWRTMTKDEWSYLLSNHTKGWAAVNGVNGLVIRPDGVSTAVESTYTAEAWADEEAAGSVFLPAAGVRVGKVDAVNNSYVSSVGSNTYYWTATHFNNGFLGAYRTDISNNQTTVTYNGNPACGNAVRLVRTVE